MFPYIAVLMCVVLVILIQEFGFKSKLKFFNLNILTVTITSIFIAFYSLRDFIGYDYNMYYYVIKNGQQEGYLYRNEYLSYLLMNMAHQAGDPHLFFCLIAFFAIPLYFYSIAEYSENNKCWGWSILWFLAIPVGLIQTLSVSRQFISVGIILYATRYIFSREFVKYLFCIVVGTMFHFTSLICILFYFISSKKFRYYYFSIAFFICIIFFVVGQTVISLYFPQYEMYIEIIDKTTQQGGFTQTLLYLVLGIVFLYGKKHNTSLRYDVFLKIYLLGCILVLIFSLHVGLLGVRLGFAALTYSIFLIPYFFDFFNNRDRKYVKILTFILCVLLYYYGLFITADYNSYIPYKTFL